MLKLCRDVTNDIIADLKRPFDAAKGNANNDAKVVTPITKEA
jgi:hypothetical protein